MPKNTISLILAGGEGKRLTPLTLDRAKPAVPFDGKYRIVDFALANHFNSSLRRIYVLLQFAPHSLALHIQRSWEAACGMYEFVRPLYPKMRNEAEQRYTGTANAVLQNWNEITAEGHDVDTVTIFAGDHIYIMDISQAIQYHRQKASDFTVCIAAVPIDLAANELGVLQVDSSNRITRFLEKPPRDQIPEIPGRPGYCYVSMGNYVANLKTLGEFLAQDASNVNSQHDFGKNIIPDMMRGKCKVYAYPFDRNEIEGQPVHYWRDVGTIEAYYDAHMELLRPDEEPPLNLTNPHWKIPTFNDNLPSADIVGGTFVNTRLAGGVNIQKGGMFTCSSIGRGMSFGRDVEVHACILIANSHIGDNCVMRHVICDKNVTIPPNTKIGYDREKDEKLFRVVTLSEEEGTYITVIPKGYQFQTT